MTLQREQVLGAVADGIGAARTDGQYCRVAVDGVDGAGKTTFADELAAVLETRCVAAVRASVDGFHNPPGLRYWRGRGSPVGFFEDSYDQATLREVLLDPLGPGGSGRFVPAVHDVTVEQPVPRRWRQVPAGAVLLFDGIFLHREELHGLWDYSVFLDVPFEVSIPRGAQRGYGDPDPAAPANRRYVEGQRLYLATCRPRIRATVVVDNTDLGAPTITRRTGRWGR